MMMLRMEEERSIQMYEAEQVRKELKKNNKNNKNHQKKKTRQRPRHAKHQRNVSMMVSSVVACRQNDTISRIIGEAVKKCDLDRLIGLQKGKLKNYSLASSSTNINNKTKEETKQEVEQVPLVPGRRSSTTMGSIGMLRVAAVHFKEEQLKRLRDPNMWRLKVVGRCDYLMDIDRKVIASIHVQECLRKNKPVVLKLVRANDAFEVTGQADKHAGVVTGTINVKHQSAAADNENVTAVVLTDLSEANQELGYLRCVQGEEIILVNGFKSSAFLLAIATDGRQGLVPTTHIQALDNEDDEEEEEEETETEQKNQQESIADTKLNKLRVTSIGTTASCPSLGKHARVRSKRNSSMVALTAGQRASVATRTFTRAGIHNDRLAALLDVADDALMGEGFSPQPSKSFLQFTSGNSNESMQGLMTKSEKRRFLYSGCVNNSATTNDLNSNETKESKHGRDLSLSFSSNHYHDDTFVRKRSSTVLSSLWLRDRNSITGTNSSSNPSSNTHSRDSSTRFSISSASSATAHRRNNSNRRLSVSARSQIEMPMEDIEEEKKNNSSFKSNIETNNLNILGRSSTAEVSNPISDGKGMSSNAFNASNASSMSPFVSSLDSPWPYRITVQGISNINALHPPLKKEKHPEEDDSTTENDNNDSKEDSSSDGRKRRSVSNFSNASSASNTSNVSSSSQDTSRGSHSDTAFNTKNSSSFGPNSNGLSKAMLKARKEMGKLKFMWLQMDVVLNGEILATSTTHIAKKGMSSDIRYNGGAKHSGNQISTESIPGWIYFQQHQIFHHNELKRVNISDLPLSSRIRFTIYGCKDIDPPKSKRSKRKAAGEHELKPRIIGGVSMSIYDHRRVLRSGMLQLRVWSGSAGELHTACVENTSKRSHLSSRGVAVIHIKLDEFPRSVRYALPPTIPRGIYKLPLPKDRPSAKLPKSVREDVMKETMCIVHQFDPLSTSLNVQQMKRIWQARFDLASDASHLPVVLRSVNWQDDHAAQEAYDLLSVWAPLSPLQSLELLGYRFGDYRVRQYAVRRLEEFTDTELGQFVLQLVQALKVEPFHRSPLAFFLVRRALASPELVGQTLFWQLRSEMHNPRVAERFGVLLRSYLVQATHHRNALSRQNDVQNMLKACADDVVNASRKISGEKLIEFCREKLNVSSF